MSRICGVLATCHAVGIHRTTIATRAVANGRQISASAKNIEYDL